MKAVLLATDYLKDTDGSFKILETNTSITIATQFTQNYFNGERFNQFVIDNGITEIYLLTHRGGSMVNSIDLNYNEGDEVSSILFLPRKSVDGEITYHVKPSPNNNNPFYVEDASNRLIIRLAYDENALIDETYAKDNFNFLKLISDSDPSLICPTYFNDGVNLTVDTLGETIRDNGIYPNYIIKKRYPTTDYGTYPKVLKINNLEELNLLKQNLLGDELLQEYILNLNDLENGKLKTYRTVQMIYGSNLDVYDFMEPYFHTNKSPIDSTVDYDVNGYIETWERPKFLQKVGNTTLNNRFHTYSFSNVLLSDNTLVSVNDVMVGDTIKSNNLYKLNLDKDHLWPTYSESSTNVFNQSTPATAEVVSKEYEYDFILSVKLILDNGLEFTYGNDGIVLTEDSENNIRFIQINKLAIGDKVVINYIETDQFESRVITSLVYQYKNVGRYAIDVEESDLYLKTDDSNSPQYYMINHNKEQIDGSCDCYTGFDLHCTSPCLSSVECSQVFKGICCGKVPEGFVEENLGPGPCSQTKE